MKLNNLKIMAGSYSIFKLEVSDIVPDFVLRSEFFSILKSDTELSIICLSCVIPMEFKCECLESDWSLMKLIGPFSFEQSGVLRNLIDPLASECIGILAVSSFDTDYLLVKSKNMDRAITCLKQHNYSLIV